MPQAGKRSRRNGRRSIRVGGAALTLINDGTYGSDFRDGVIRPTLLRGPGYSRIRSGPAARRAGPFSPRIDQGSGSSRSG